MEAAPFMVMLISLELLFLVASRCFEDKPHISDALTFSALCVLTIVVALSVAYMARVTMMFAR